MVIGCDDAVVCGQLITCINQHFNYFNFVKIANVWHNNGDDLWLRMLGFSVLVGVLSDVVLLLKSEEWTVPPPLVAPVV